MKKILVSVSIIAAAAAVVIGATTAYFSDTETSTGNTFTAGTIDIDIDGYNPFTRNFNIGDLKPGETGYMNFKINNVGTNPVNVSKKLYGFAKHDSGESYNCEGISGGGGYFASSEPECVAEAGTRKDEVQTQIIYDLSVEVYKNPSEKIWWQTIYSDGEGKHISDVYQGSNYVVLGMIPADGYMLVTQSYHFDPNAGNEYQGDGLTFDMEIKGDQLNQSGGATVTLENKSGAPDWNIIETDNINGVLTYQTKGPEFEYSFTASGLESGDYQLIYYPDPWKSSKQIVLIGDAMTASGGSINVSNSVELNMDLPNSISGFDDNYPDGAKVWLVPTSSLSGTTLSWTNTSKFLFETALIKYDDTDL